MTMSTESRERASSRPARYLGTLTHHIPSYPIPSYSILSSKTTYPYPYPIVSKNPTPQSKTQEENPVLSNIIKVVSVLMIVFI